MTDEPASFHNPLRQTLIDIGQMINDTMQDNIQRDYWVGFIKHTLDHDPAPDLYAALEEAEEILSDLPDDGDSYVQEVRRQVWKALAKARGD